ncbi:hypothetical protein [Crystallibacter crystallopoietes]|nr:hypothetical protein [Arthrobacter crystallopoietes]
MSTVIAARAGLRVMSLAEYEQVAAARQEFVDFLLGSGTHSGAAEATPRAKATAW